LAGSVRLAAPNRLRNDTGQRIVDSVYYDYNSSQLYDLPPLEPGQEVQLDTITPKPARGPNKSDQLLFASGTDYRQVPAHDLAATAAFEFSRRGRVFAGFCEGPALPVELNVPHEQNIHSLILVSLEQP
jgi:hypothetical protein